ncbi:hypothetical protein NL676_021657 [Syzygium grande]|nr:hypothetical protein NL676_021657 [Syzygium grande]
MTSFLAATMDDQEYVPFGEDYSYRDFLLRMFEGGEESPEIEEGYSYRNFLLHMFKGGEESPEIEEEEIMDEPSEGLEDSDFEVNANVQTNVIEEANPCWNKYAFGYAIAASMICILLDFG